MKRFLAVLIVFVAMLCFGRSAEAGVVENAIYRVGSPAVRLAAKPLKFVKACAANVRENISHRVEKRKARRSARSKK